MFYGAHLYVFRYGKLCFVIYISILQSNNRFLQTYSVLSIQFFSLLFPSSLKIVYYILLYIIIYNIK